MRDFLTVVLVILIGGLGYLIGYHDCERRCKQSCCICDPCKCDPCPCKKDCCKEKCCDKDKHP